MCVCTRGEFGDSSTSIIKIKQQPQRMQQCIQLQAANLLEPWPHTNTLKLTRAGGNQYVYSTCHPSFGKNLLVCPEPVQRLNKHSLAYAMHYCFPEFASANHSQISPLMQAGCRNILRIITDDPFAAFQA